ncbi:Putative Methylthioribulose-1-phosphate dehydratase [Rhizopus microsporus]|nr:Putative Methylthioribulose-1-phosphate dehydratase [Rhizopus microsporus]
MNTLNPPSALLSENPTLISNVVTTEKSTEQHEVKIDLVDHMTPHQDPSNPFAFLPEQLSALIHTHSQNAVMATLLYPGKTFEISHQEMIKGIRIGSTTQNLRYFDKLVVPIVENTPEEEDLTDRMAAAMREYPNTNAVLVRRHGVYVWGETWEKAKTMTECYDYLFEIAVKMKSIGIDPAKKPEGEPDYE